MEVLRWPARVFELFGIDYDSTLNTTPSGRRGDHRGAPLLLCVGQTQPQHDVIEHVYAHITVMALLPTRRFALVVEVRVRARERGASRHV